MATINLRDYYPWYAQNEFVEVPDEVVEALLAGKRCEKAQRRRVYRHKAQYSLNTGDGIENEAVQSFPSPEEILEDRLRRQELYTALAILPEKQRRRIEAHYFDGKSVTDIARDEGVAKSSVSESIERGLLTMKKILKKFF